MSNAKAALYRVIPVSALCFALACGNDSTAPLKPDDYVGHYELAQVDGHDVGWYHQLNAVDCSAAFTSGSRLTIAPDRYFYLYLPYKFRCLGADPFDGEGVLGIVGQNIKATEELIVLNGSGPGLLAPGVDRWSLEIRPQATGEYVEVRFWGYARDYWADPILIMGPKETYDPACLTAPCSPP